MSKRCNAKFLKIYSDKETSTSWIYRCTFPLLVQFNFPEGLGFLKEFDVITFILWNIIFKLFKINITTVFNALPCVAKSLWLIGLIVEFVLLFCKTVRINESNIFWLHTCTFPSSFWCQQCTNLINDYKQLAECVFHRETTGSLQLLCLLISPIMTLSYPSDRPSAWVAHYRHFNTASRTSTEETGQTDRIAAV